MAEESLTDLRVITEFSRAGLFSDVKDYAMPFLAEIDNSLAELGMGTGEQSTDASSFSVPEGLFPKSKLADTLPRADLGISALVVGVTLFLGTSVGSWAVQKLCDEYYNAKVRPALVGLVRRWRKDKHSRGKPPPVAVFDHWFDVDQVLVRVALWLDGQVDKSDPTKHITEALRSAQDYIKNNGVTRPVMVYRVRNGELSAPSLYDQVPRKNG